MNDWFVVHTELNAFKSIGFSWIILDLISFEKACIGCIMFIIEISKSSGLCQIESTKLIFKSTKLLVDPKF